MGPSIGAPDLDPLPGDLRATVAIKVGDDISTDEILPASTP
jgi:aconitate hydratase